MYTGRTHEAPRDPDRIYRATSASVARTIAQDQSDQLICQSGSCYVLDIASRYNNICTFINLIDHLPFIIGSFDCFYLIIIIFIIINEFMIGFVGQCLDGASLQLIMATEQCRRGMLFSILLYGFAF